MRRLVFVIVTLAGCWRGAAPYAEPTSFVARVDARADLERDVDALQPRLDYAMQRIVGLASEAERDAIRSDLSALEREVVQLWRFTDDSRRRGDSSPALDRIEHKLQRTALSIASLREELRYAKTTAELAALRRISSGDESGDDATPTAELPAERMRRRTIRMHAQPLDAPRDIIFVAP